MRLLTFNQYSIDESSTIDEVNEFFLELSKGIKKYILENGIQNSRFFTELENFIKYEIIKGYKIIDAIKALSRDLQSIILDLITMRCNDDCLNNLSREDEEKITNYEIIFSDEAPKNDYMILSFVFEKNGILLSFNRDRWNTSIIKALKFQDNQTTEISIDNIATEIHAQEHIDKSVLAKLPIENIIYSNEFKDFLLKDRDLNNHKGSKYKIIEQLKEATNKEFNIDMDLIKPLDKEIFEVRIGSLGGLQKSQIRILFKFEDKKKYILYGLVKQGSNSYDYSNDISTSIEIFKQLKEKESDEL